MVFPGDSVVKNLPANAGDVGSISVWGRFPGEGNGNPLQYSCLENTMDRRAWKAVVHGVGKSWTWLSLKQVLFLYDITVYMFWFRFISFRVAKMYLSLYFPLLKQNIIDTYHLYDLCASQTTFIYPASFNYNNKKEVYSHFSEMETAVWEG